MVSKILHEFYIKCLKITTPLYYYPKDTKYEISHFNIKGELNFSAIALSLFHGYLWNGQIMVFFREVVWGGGGRAAVPHYTSCVCCEGRAVPAAVDTAQGAYTRRPACRLLQRRRS